MIMPIAYNYCCMHDKPDSFTTISHMYSPYMQYKPNSFTNITHRYSSYTFLSQSLLQIRKIAKRKKDLCFCYNIFANLKT